MTFKEDDEEQSRLTERQGRGEDDHGDQKGDTGIEVERPSAFAARHVSDKPLT